MNCPKCGTANAPNTRFCSQCGQDLTALKICPHCQSPVVAGMVFCPQCGKRLEPTIPQPSSGQEPPVDQAPAPLGNHPASSAQPAAPGSSSIVQSVVGNHNIQVNLSNINGSQIDLTIEADEHPKPLPLPVDLRPPAFPGLLDRQAELQDVAQELAQRAPIEICGENGLGKTSLLRVMGNSPAADLEQYPAGVVYLNANGRPVDDLLHSLYAQFHQIPRDYKPTPEEIQRGLHPLQALVLLDNAVLTRDQLTDLRSQAPNCTFVLATTERALWGEGHSLALSGLPPDESLALIVRELGRPLAPSEQPIARQLCTALNGNPDRLLKLAAYAREGQSFTAIQKSLDQAAFNPVLVSGLSTPEKRILSVVALGRNAPIPVEHIAPLADLPDMGRALQLLQGLQQRQLVQAHSPSYTLTGALAQELWRDWDLAPWADRALDYFSRWCESGREDPRRMFDSLDVIYNLLEWAVHERRWAQVLRLGRLIQVALALSLRWAAWLQVLTWVLMAARALADKLAEGWALHQIGTQSLCVGNRAEAQSHLTQALQLRQAIGDQAGAAVTRHNLDLLLGPLAPPSQGGQPQTPPKQPPASSSTPSVLGGVLKGLLFLIGIAGLVGIVLTLAIWQPWRPNRTVPTSRPSPFPIRTPSPTLPRTTVILPIEVAFSLEAGCGVAYPPGMQAFTYVTSQDGWITVQLDGRTLPDFEHRPVIGQAQSSGQVELPAKTGPHTLNASFDFGTQVINRECAFSIMDTSPPEPEHIPLSSLKINLIQLNPCEKQQVQAIVTLPQGNRTLRGARLFYRPAGVRTFIQQAGEVIDDFTFEVAFTEPSDGGSRDFYLEIDYNDGSSATTQPQLGRVVAGLIENDANATDDVNIPQFCVAFLVVPGTILKGENMVNMPPPKTSSLSGMLDLCHSNSNCHGFSFNGNTQDFGLYVSDPVLTPDPAWISGVKFLTPIPR